MCSSENFGKSDSNWCNFLAFTYDIQATKFRGMPSENFGKYDSNWRNFVAFKFNILYIYQVLGYTFKKFSENMFQIGVIW